ncbi:constitutive coactivator of PPAR-gamma-like protein 1 homolog isoform X2 [Coccinella septempunctata]|uniref:constitutive coactivator of PPAR-gamma-like protein 1 homolog isoform X2 n=1 Tax=Coccinella septempunctata TaxID=41139 RepID=UPI001D0752F6|nr:constitutive coactivator of PPAR-gamma-like protein 1 homolog isoform X2 [Coccinella septempunctata]
MKFRMGVQHLQKFLESPNLEGGAVSVDLLKIARNVTQRQQPHNTNRKIRPIGNKLKLIVDAENCLDRLYGGYFSDWACGGQWNRMVQFLSLLTQAIEPGSIELAVVFNGTIESCRMNEWISEQAIIRERVTCILKHINTKATPPPKVWWIPPTCLRSALRMALRHLGITVMCTMDDHHQEVIAYCREYGFHGLLADDAEYAAFDPPRYFSSENLKLTYKGSLETKEYMVRELTKTLNLSQEQVCVMAALLGNFLLSESSLQDLYRRIGLTDVTHNMKEKDDLAKIEANMRQLADYVKNLPQPSSMDALVEAVFGNDKRASKFRQSVQYYLNGTASGFLKYCAPAVTKEKNTESKEFSERRELEEENSNAATGGFASETTEQERETLQNYKMAIANVVISSDILSNSQETIKNRGCPKSNLVTPTVAADVLRTASLRHQKGLMVPQILHVLSTQEIRLPCLMEDELNREFPSIHDIYQPLRQNVYAVIFNLHHLRYLHSKKKESNEVSENDAPPDIFVKEWKYSRSNPYLKPEEVKAEPLPWAVPTLHRLWFGPAMDDKRRRMRALLSCLSSDSPLILNTAYVPQHMLIMACVLRYIMSQDRCILRPQELDAFLCQAFSTDLMNAQYLQELTLSVVTSRGVQLASLFMQGVEYAIFANDACGAPLPWLMCCPWLYFDGKLFHHVLARSAHSKNILELCESHIERVIKVERMRKAILEGLDVKFAKPPLTAFQGLTRPNLGGSSCLPQMPIPSARSNPGLRRPVLSKGGQLQVAGVVVGSWGANYGYQGLNRQSACPLNYRAGRGDNQFLQNCKERGQGGKSYTPGYPVGNRKQPTNKKRSASNKSNNNSNKTAPNQSRTLTVNTEGGDVPVLEGRIVGAKEDEQIQSNKEEQHHGQGDALSKVESQKY